MMKIDPVFTFWLGVVTTIMQGVATGTVHLTALVPDAYIPIVTGWLSLFVFINMSLLTALTGFSSNKSGPLAPPPTLPEARAVLAEAQSAAAPKPLGNPPLAMFILAAIAVGLLIGDARAADVPQPRPRPDAAGRPFICDPLNLIPGCMNESSPTGSVDIFDLAKKIAALTLPDLDYASAMAKAAGTPGGILRATCWQALITANTQLQGTALKNPDGTPMTMPASPHVFTDVEQLAEIVDSLQPNGPLVSGCAAAAQAAKMNVLNFISLGVAGAAGFAALGVT